MLWQINYMKSKILFSIICILFLSACSNFTKKSPLFEKESQISDLQNSIVQKVKYKEWTKIQKGLFIKEFVLKKNDGSYEIIVVTKINPKFYKFTLHQDTKQPKNISEWQDFLNSDIVVNGGFFDNNFNSTGGLIIDKKIFGKLTKTGENGYTGMIIIDKKNIDLKYLPKQQFQVDIKNLPDYALQSFPTLIIPDGKRGIIENSNKKAKRTIIAKDKNKNILFINTKNSTMTLFEIMEFLLNSDLNINIAINLDGGKSSGIKILTNNFYYEIPSITKVPNVIAVKYEGFK